MTTAELPWEDHFAVHCSGIGGKNFSDEEDDYHQPPWLSGVTFAPTIENPNVSGLWVEREGGTFEQQLDRLREELIASKRKVRNSHQMVVVEVSTIKRLGQKYSRDLHAIFAPDEEMGLPSHAEIAGIHPADRILQQKIADEASVPYPIFPS